jgi:hypothetical protein
VAEGHQEAAKDGEERNQVKAYSRRTTDIALTLPLGLRATGSAPGLGTGCAG